MPEDDAELGGDSDQTVTKKDYEKLQRTLDRRTKEKAKAQTEASNLSASVNRLEGMMEQFMGVQASTDPDLKPSFDAITDANTKRRKADESAAELTARLTQALDKEDEDWEDAKFDAARRILNEINETGDLSKGYEVERLVNEALAPSEDDLESRITAAAEAAVLKDRQDYNRVDSNQSRVVSGQRYTRQNLDDLDWTSMSKDQKNEQRDAIYKQLGIG